MAEEGKSPSHRHSWWWIVIPCLLVTYVLGMAPLRAGAQKWHASRQTVVTISWMEWPLLYVAAHWETGRQWHNDYQNWWNRKMGLPFVILLR